MPGPCFFVAYASSAIRPFSRDDLSRLLCESRERNSRVQVTGLLLHRGGNFLQALEGPEQAVRETMLRISRDRRHRSIVPLHEGWNDQRLFGEWQMGFEDVRELAGVMAGTSNYLSGEEEIGLPADTRHDVFEFFSAFRDHLR